MAGRTPADAVAAFMHPIQEAASVLGPCKVTGAGEFRSPRVGHEYSWSLNDGAGIKGRNAHGVTGVRDFYASMSWRVVPDDRDGYGPFRVTTTRYDYSLILDDGEVWAFHWHPEGRSDVVYPHVHFGSPVLASTSPITSKAHPPTGRMTLEQTIRWVLESGGTSPFHDWPERLALAEAPHLLYRSWTQNRPREASPSGD